MKSIQDIAAFIFIAAIAILSVVSVFGVWEIFEKDVIKKSFQTFGLLTAATAAIMIAGRFLEGRAKQEGVAKPDLPSPVFQTIRQGTITLFVVAVAILALVGALAIWELIEVKEALFRSLSSLTILAFGAFVIVVTSLERENKNKQILWGQILWGQKTINPGIVVWLIILASFLVWFLSFLY